MRLFPLAEKIRMQLRHIISTARKDLRLIKQGSLRLKVRHISSDLLLPSEIPHSSFGRRFSVSGKLFDPEDLTKLRTYSDEAISTSQRARELLSAMGVKLDTATNELVSAVQKEGEAAVGAINAKASQEAYKASQAQSLFAAFGLQAQANKSLQEMALQDQLIEAAKPKIDQLLAVNPLANPIAYMLAQFQLSSPLTRVRW